MADLGEGMFFSINAEKFPKIDKNGNKMAENEKNGKNQEKINR